MKFLITLAIIGTVSFNIQASSFLNSLKQVGSSTSSTTYDLASLKSELMSNNVSCLSFKRKVYPSKGYIAKFGNTKSHCTTKRAKVDGVTRITANDLTTSAFIAINK